MFVYTRNCILTGGYNYIEVPVENKFSAFFTIQSNRNQNNPKHRNVEKDKNL